MKITRPLLSILVLSLICFTLNAQHADSALGILDSKLQQEKIYIQYDKEYYVAGETIWFKAYLYDNGKPSGISNNFYLQFADAKGKVISNKKYPVMGAVIKGNIVLPDSLPQGNYYVRALTPSMLNNDEAFIYHKNIFIAKPSLVKAKENAVPVRNISVQFFPESGNLVAGILMLTAFKAVDQWGVPADVNGVIHTDDGTTVASFKSYHDGIGKVQFRPLAGKKYTADIETNGGTKTFALPEVQTAGINLKIQDEKGGKSFQVSRSEKDKDKYEGLMLIAEINNKIVYETEITFENYPSVKGHLITDSLPSGILHFTVFSSAGVPLAERLSFVNNREYVSTVNINVEKKGIEKRAENNLSVDFPDALQRSCSVAVTAFPSMSFNDNDNIWSRFLLTSDLKGYVYNPAWYFPQTSGEENPTDSLHQAFDNLMLTHGWSKFSWTKILAGEFPDNKITDPYLFGLSGIVKDHNNNEILAGGKVNIYLEAEDSSTQNFEAKVNSSGHFNLDSIAFFGNSALYYTYADSKGKQVPARIAIDDNQLDKKITLLPLTFTDNIATRNFNSSLSVEEIQRQYEFTRSKFDDVKELEKVYVQSRSSKKPIDIVNDKYTTGVFRTMGKVNLDNINDPANDRSMNVVDYIKNRIQQLEIQGGRFVNRKNFSLASGQKWIVDVFINEIPATILELRTMRADQVSLVKFFEAGFVGVGSGAPGGAIAVYTKEVSNNEKKPDQLEHVNYNGYSVTKEFYSPDYSIAEAKHPVQDNRTTIYWNPNVYTDADSKSVKLHFYNNDFSKKYKVVIEGFDATGKLVHVEKIVE